MAKYFGTNGVRGRFDLLGPMLAMEIAQGVGIYFKRGRELSLPAHHVRCAEHDCGKILLARDARLTGECLNHSVIAGLQSVGCEVLDMGFAPAPTAEFMVSRAKADGLIIITASHNPPEWNALKVVDGNGVTVSHERGAEIEALMAGPVRAQWNAIGRESRLDGAVEQHAAAMRKLVDARKIAAKNPKIVLDCGNGMAALLAPQLFRDLGCRVVLLNEKVDGRFPGRPSEPTEANVKALLDAVVREKADAGFAWDGDGDRLIAVDERGKYVIGDRVFALSVLLKMREKKGGIVTTVATSKAAEDIAARHGCRTVYTAIGAPYLSEEMAKGKAAIGGEEVGGVIWPELSLAKDGFFTAAKLTEALCERPLSAWLKEVPVYFNAKTKIPATAEQKKRIVDGMRAHAKKAKLRSMGVDGVRVDFEDSWVIVRASGTEDYVRVFAEAKTEKRAKELLEEYSALALSFGRGSH